MTDATRPRARLGRGARSLGPASIGIVLFAAVLAVLAIRIRSGADPALQARETVATPPVPRILVRRVEVRRVIHHLPPDEPVRPASSSEQLSGSAAQLTAPTVTRAS